MIYNIVGGSSIENLQRVSCDFDRLNGSSPTFLQAVCYVGLTRLFCIIIYDTAFCEICFETPFMGYNSVRCVRIKADGIVHRGERPTFTRT